MVAKTQKESLFKSGEYKVEKVVELSFFAIKTDQLKGSSNKSYHIELELSNKNQKAQIYSMYGATGSKMQKDWRHYESHEKASKEFESIIKSKKKKGYVEVDVAQRTLGSEEAKSIIKPVTLINSDQVKSASVLHSKVQYLIKELFGKTNSFCTELLKCPLGQLTNAQIDKGRNILDEAKIIVDKKKKSKDDKDQLEKLTNDFYSSIPHNLGSGARGQLIHLLLDDEMKIAQKEADLDTLLDAKVLNVSGDTGVDEQYKSLNTDINYIEDERVNWVDNLVQKTKASNHHFLGKIKVLNVWEINRKTNKEFTELAKEIGKECRGQVIPDIYKGLKIDTRNDIEDIKLFEKANILPLFHGTRTENLIGITQKGLLIRPSTAIITGAMYGAGCYFGFSSKSINYTNISSSYWAQGKNDKAYIFIADVLLGNQKIADRSYQYTKNNIKPHHSVWAKGGYSGVINDEFIIYDTHQSNLRYLIEFTCQK